MTDPTPRLIAILEQYMRDPGAPVSPCTRLSDLEIDLADLPLIILDIEDAFGIQMSYDDEVEGFTSVGALAECVRAHLCGKPRRSRASSPAPARKSLWLSTGADRRR